MEKLCWDKKFTEFRMRIECSRVLCNYQPLNVHRVHGDLKSERPSIDELAFGEFLQNTSCLCTCTCTMYIHVISFNDNFVFDDSNF